MKFQNTSDKFHSSISNPLWVEEGIYRGLLVLIHMEEINVFLKTFLVS